MKKYGLALLFCLMTKLTYAQTPLSDMDFKLIGPNAQVAIKQTKSREQILEDIQRSLDNIQRQLDVIGNKVGVPAVQTQTQTQYRRFVQQTHQQAPAAPRTAPTTDNGPGWTYDPTTNSYFRYVPIQRPSPRPLQYTVPQTMSRPVYTQPTRIYNSTPSVMVNCPT
jgi:hypothetical protein